MSKLLRAGAVAGALCLVASCTPTDPKFAFNYAEMRGVLPNGLRFVILPDPSTQLVEVDVRYGVGAREDPPGKAGLAHMVEHTMFQLRPDGETSPPLFEFVSQLSTFFNAYTSWDQTHYQTTARADELEPLLKIEAMRLFYGCKTVPEAEFIREREVVRNEIRWRGGDAQGQIPPTVLADAYPKGHGYAHMPGGDDEQISHFELKDACEFIDKYYTPSNATVVIAGGVDYDKTVALIQKWFGKLPKKDAAPRKAIEVAPANPGRHEYSLDIDAPVLAVSWPLPPANTEEGRNVRYGLGQLFGETAEKAQEYDFADSVSPATLGGEEAPVFSILIQLKSMDKLDEALDFVWKSAKSAHRQFADVSWQQFDNMRKKAKARFIESLEPLGARTNTVADLVQYDKDIDFDAKGSVYLIDELNRYDHFDGDAISSAVTKYLDPDRATIDIFKPSSSGKKGDVRSTVTYQTQSDAGGMTQPEVDPKEAGHPLKVGTELTALDGAIRYQLSNGMKIVLLPTKGSMPLIAAQLQFKVGDAQSSTPGLAAEAAELRNPPMDSEVMAATGIVPRGQASDDMTIFSTRAINIYLEVVIKGLERMITAGSYDQDEIEQWQKSQRAAFKDHQTQEETEFQRQAADALFGADHPYAKNAVLLPDQIGGIGYDALTKFARDHYTAGNATLIITGNFDVEQAKHLISDAFGGWSKGTVDKPVSTDARPRTGPEFIGVAGKERPQLEVAIEFPAPAGIDGEAGARQLVAQMLRERMDDIRFKLGSTYGLQVGYRPQLGPGYYEITGTIDAKRAGESLKAMQDGIEALRNPTDQWNIDFVRARRALIQQLLGVSTVSAELAFRLGAIDEFGLKPDAYNTRLKMIAAASTAEVKALIARELDPQKEIIVTLADKQTVEDAFKAAGITDVKIVEPTYK